MQILSINSVHFSCTVVSDSLPSHGLQYVRPLCPSPPCHHQLPEFTQTHVHRVGDAIQPFHPLPSPSSFAIPFSSCLQSYPASESFQVSQFFASGHQSIGDLAPESVLLMTIQKWFPLGLTGLISLLSKEHSRVFSNIIIQKHQFFGTQPSSQSNSLTSTHDHRKNHSLD